MDTNSTTSGPGPSGRGNDKGPSAIGALTETAAHFALEPEASDTKAWEQVAAGRYMPRRIRGSFKGRALG